MNLTHVRLVGPDGIVNPGCYGKGWDHLFVDRFYDYNQGDSRRLRIDHAIEAARLRAFESEKVQQVLRVNGPTLGQTMWLIQETELPTTDALARRRPRKSSTPPKRETVTTDEILTAINEEFAATSLVAKGIRPNRTDDSSSWLEAEYDIGDEALSDLACRFSERFVGDRRVIRSDPSRIDIDRERARAEAVGVRAEQRRRAARRSWWR